MTWAIIAPSRARGDGQPADRADRRQRLAPKAKEADVDQIIIGEFRGGVAFDGERQILRPHADAVVGHADKALAAAPKRDVDLACIGINGVLDKFLHHAGRALDHLARRDAVHRSF